jgi:hypothetical protein
MENGKLYIKLFTIPQEACDQKELRWTDVATMLKNQMRNTFHGEVVFKHIEFMSEEWFSDANPQTLLENGVVNFPFVLVNDEIACSEFKVNISKVRRFAETKFNKLNDPQKLPN